MKSNRLGYCKHTSYTNRGGSLKVWGRSWGVWGGSFPPATPPPPHWIEPCNLCLRNLKKLVIDADRKRVEEKSKDHPSLLYILRVAKENLWLKFWDVALEHGLDGSKSSMALLKVLSLTLFRDRQCPVSNCVHTVSQDSPLCVTPAFVTENIISSTSNPEHFVTLIPLGLSLLKALPF